MSDSAGRVEPPPWAGSQPEAAEDHVKAREALALLHDQFEKLNGPTREQHEQHSVRRLASVFDPLSSRAIEALTARLLDLLFDSPEEYLIGDETKRVYLVMFIGSDYLRELWRFIERILTTALTEDQEIPSKKVVTDFLGKWTQEVRSAVSLDTQKAQSTSQKAAMWRWVGDLDAASNDFQQALAASSVEIAEKAAEDTLRARDLARQAAGDTGAATLGGHFKHIADEESKTAFGWTATTIASLAAVIGAGIYIISRSVTTQWIDTLFHLALVLPIIGLATFSARLARHHRLLGRWAKTAAVQVNSVAAFAEQLPTDKGALRE